MEDNLLYSKSTTNLIMNFIQKHHHRDYPGGTVVKNPPVNAGDTGLSPGPGRYHMPQSS